MLASAADTSHVPGPLKHLVLVINAGKIDVILAYDIQYIVYR